MDKEKKGQMVEGTPNMVLMPSKRYQFLVLDAEHKITVPRKGKYHELAPEIFEEEEGAFNILDEENGVLYIPSITKVLFATNQYPDLEPLQLFAPTYFLINEDTVDIVGQVIEIIPKTPAKKGE
jgi:hypothetical protein